MRILIFGGDSDIAKAIAKQNKDTILINKLTCDVRLSDTVSFLIDRFKPDVVVNCAGISIVGTIKKQSVDDWVRQISINLLGSYNIAKACVDKHVDKLILIASVAGKYGKPNHSAYSVSKAGVITLVQSLGKEGYKAYAISPGRVDTKMREFDYPGEDKRTRLTTKNVADVVFQCIRGKYKPGDNIIVRKRGFRRLRRIDRGQPWKEYLNL
jgi:NAD(P)-dependent dehydrogenase (short-subunit alcohol dehydrogenase family)